MPKQPAPQAPILDDHIRAYFAALGRKGKGQAKQRPPEQCRRAARARWDTATDAKAAN